MTTTWVVLVDWDRNGDFSGTYDDVTNRVLEARWSVGFREQYTEMADSSIATLVLDNSDKRFSSENGSSPLAGRVQPLRPVQIRSHQGNPLVYTVHFMGWIQGLAPMPGMFGPRTITLIATDAMQFLKVAETKLALQQNKRTDEIVDLLMKEVILPPALTRATILDMPNYSLLDTETWLPSTTFYSVYDKGAVTMTVAGDNWVNDGGYSDKPKDTFDVYRAIRDMVSAERGKFFFDRDGRAVFWNRQHLLYSASPAVTLSDSMTGLEYTYAGPEIMQNDVTVVCHPRVIGVTADEVLWELPADSAVRVDPNVPRSVYVKYEDPDNGGRVGAQEVTYSDLVVEMGSVSTTLNVQASGAELVFTNTGTGAAYVTKCTVKGRKIVDKGLMEAREVDQASVVTYGRRSTRMNLASLMSLDDAQQIARFEIGRRATPRGDVSSVTMLSHANFGGGQHTHQLARTLGDKIALSETQTAHTAEYRIIGEAHEIKAAGTLYQTTWYLERSPSNAYFTLDVSTMDTAGTLVSY